MEQRERLHDRIINWTRHSISLRLVVIGVLTLLLLIPISFIKDLIHERQHRQESVVNEINEKWGGEVLFYGPIIKLPFKQFHQVYKTNPDTKEKIIEEQESINYVYIFPEELNIGGEIIPYEKHRGLYNSVVYQGNMNFDGFYSLPDFESLDIPIEHIVWEKAKVIIQTSNLKGINNDITIELNKQNYKFLPSFSKSVQNLDFEQERNLRMHSLVSKNIKLKDSADFQNMVFHFNMDFNGSKQIRFIPIGRKSNVELKSNWKSPSFIGNFLPNNEDKIKVDGFEAKWQILNINRGFGQIFKHELPNLKEYAFGVNLMMPVDQYQQSMRSVKYGYLVILLTFLVFFLIQTISKIQIHSFQYLMIGIALTVFYTLLISISEHTNFISAYIMSGVAVIMLISLYSKSIFKDKRFSLLVGSSLTVLYSFIFVIIQLENYALIVGSIGLFMILSIIMYASRKIDWDFSGNS